MDLMQLLHIVLHFDQNLGSAIGHLASHACEAGAPRGRHWGSAYRDKPVVPSYNNFTPMPSRAQ